jgi:uncharacterized membrane protein YkvA (DUF1232 family)
MRLAFELARDPSIPHRHKTMLYATAVYQFSPIHWAVTPIPVIGQIDGPVLLMMSLRQILAHCPESVARKHFSRLKLQRNQLDLDAELVMKVGGDAAKTAQQRASGALRFMWRFGTGFSRRQLRRLMAGPAATTTKRPAARIRAGLPSPELDEPGLDDVDEDLGT